MIYLVANKNEILPIPVAKSQTAQSPFMQLGLV